MSPIEKDKRPTKKRVVSKDFRTVVVSAVSGGANDNLAQVVLGIELMDPELQEDFIQEEVRLVMTPRTLKMFNRVLTNLVTAVESDLGEISIPEGPSPVIKRES